MGKLGNGSLVAALVLTTACGGKATNDNDDPEAIANELGQDFGGLTADDEAPMFGEEGRFVELEEAAEDPAPPSDGAVGDMVEREVGSAESAVADPNVPERERALIYALRIAWGRKPIDRTATLRTTWDPTISTDCGALAVRKLIKMEQGEDVLRPRTSAKEVSFTSRTRPAYDGALLVLLIRPADRACTETGKLTFTSTALPSPISVPLDASLEGLDLIQDVGDGNSVALNAERLEPSSCIHGHLSGRWVLAQDAQGNARDHGRFFGRVTGPLGGLAGHVKGLFGTPARGRFAGQPVFYGKIIGPNGKFVGLLAGRYTANKFGGGWHLRPIFGNAHGLLGGRYAASPNDPEAGLFTARYASMSCRVRPAETPLAE